MSKTKTKRMVASFLLLCAMSGTKVLADPTGWTPDSDLVNFADPSGQVIFDGNSDKFSNNTGLWAAAIAAGFATGGSVDITLQGAANEFKFINNNSKDSGAAIYLSGQDVSLTIEGTSLFQENYSSNGNGAYNGGAIYNHLGTINFNKAATFIGNYADGFDGEHNHRGTGGAINNNGTILFSEGATFTGNHAYQSGGAIHNGSSSVLTLNGGSFKNNYTEGQYGGAIYNANDITLNASVADITFSGNKVAVGTDDERYNDVYLTSNGSMDLQGTSEKYSITFGGSIEGDAGTTITSSAQNVILDGDNSDFEGTFTQTAGKTTVGSTGKFFGGTNTHQIQGGSLVLDAVDAISNSKIALDTAASIDINANTTINGNVSGDGTINHATDGTTLTILGRNDAFTGTLKQQSGTLDIGDGTTVTTSFGKNDISGGTVNVEANATLTGANTISGGEVTLKDGSTLEGTNTISNGKVNINTSNNSTATNIITGGDVIVGSGVLFSGANTTLSGTGSLTVNSATLSGLSSMSGNDSALNLVGAVVDNTVNIAGGQTTISDKTTIAQGGSLNITGGQVNINQDITLGGTQGTITGAGAGGSVVMTGDNMTINGDMSGYEGSYKQTGGNITIENGSMFGGNSELKGNSADDKITITMGDASKIEAGSTVNLENASVTISNNGVESVTGSGSSTVVDTNENITTITGQIIGDTNSSISVSGNKTYLQINGDQSGYKGVFNQTDGATTEVTAGSTFFGGTSTIYDGNFIFRDNAHLVQNVTIDGENVNLVIGNGGEQYQIEDGNMYYTGDIAADGTELGFQLSKVTIEQTLFTTEGDEQKDLTATIKFSNNGGFDKDANYQIGNDKGQTGTVIFQDGAVAQDGSKIEVNEGSNIQINANTMREDAVNMADTGKFGSDISGEGIVEISNTNDSAKALVFTSDNTAHKGEMQFKHGAIKFEGIDQTPANAAKFFNGTNLIGDGNSANGTSSVIFAANSVVQGQNTINQDGSFVLTDGASIADEITTGTGINLTTGGTLSIENTTTDLNLTVGVQGSENATINKTADGKLLISANQNEYTGIYNHSAGTTELAANTAFFGGTNNITGGTVDAATNEGAIINGINTITGTGNMIIGDTTVVNSDTITVGDTQGSDAGKLTLQTDPNNEVDLNVDFDIVSGAAGSGTVEMAGAGALNLDNPNQNLSGFTGVFSQIGAGVTNVFGKFFGGTNNIAAGTLNMKNGSELVAGSTTTISNGAALNIGAEIQNDPTKETGDKFNFDENSKVNIAGNVAGDGNVNVGNGQVTIAGTSDNTNFTGNYTQTGGVVTAEDGSTFFGSVQNLINKGKLVFKQGAKLATDKNVTLNGNHIPPEDDTERAVENAVLDLDGRTNAKFNGDNKLVLDGEATGNEGFVFTNGTLQNAILSGTQSIGDDAVVTLGAGSGLGADASVVVNGSSEDTAPEMHFGTGSVATEGSTVEVGEYGMLGLVSSDLDYHTITTGNGIIGVTKDQREQYAPNIRIYGDQSGFTGDFLQDAGSVTVTTGSTFFGGDNKITGSAETGLGGDLHLAQGSFLGSDITVTNSAPDNGGAFDPHGRVFIEDKIYDSQGVELTDINKLMEGDLYYNTKLDADGNLLTTELKNISIKNGGLILSNGTVFDGSQGITVFEKNQNGGVVDIGFSNGSGVDGDIELREDTMLSYGDGAYIKGDSILTMDGTSVLNFINDSETINYNPTIVGGGSIWKEGLGTTNISSAIDMTGQVKVTEGTLNFTNKDKVVFNGGGSDPKQDGSLTVGSDNTNAVINISANNTTFGGNVSANAQDGSQTVLNLKGANTTIGGTLTANNTASAITGNTTIGGNWTTSGDSTLSLLGGSANQIVVNGDFIVENVKDGQLPISFDYDPRGNRLDEIVVNGNYDSDSPLLITGINFITSPRDYTFDLSADRLFNISGTGDPEYAETSFYANTAMGRYFITGGGAAGSDLFGNLVYLNPQQYRGQVATIAAWQNQLLVNNLLFDHMNLVTRKLMDDEKTANKYAAAVPQIDPYQYSIKDGSLWYKAYGAFETLSMTKGLNVGNNAYGSLIGADFPLINLKHGWKLVPTAYIGYNGAHQHYNGVSMYQNGAQLGLMGTAYKGDFMTSLLAYGGGYGNDMTIRGGFGNASDNTGNWFAGVASKSAYNIRLPHDFIIQPTIMAAYNAFGQQNWGSDFGVMSMSSGMLNGLNVAPGVNFILQKKTFSLYAMAQLVYNVMGGVDGTAGNIDLGYVRMRHCYFEYGLGAMKQFKDRFTGYLQFTIRNGGRTGIGFSGGLNWKVGK